MEQDEEQEAVSILAQLCGVNSDYALSNMAGWLQQEKGLFETVYPGTRSASSDLATVSQEQCSAV